MVGNVSEWIDSCALPGPGDDCGGIGGDMNTQDISGCTRYTFFRRNLGYERLGFRCCARPAP